LYGSNLVVNGDAEASAGASDNTEVVTPPGWHTTGQFTAVKYGASGGFPDASSPGPPDRGLNLFEGGNTATSTAAQTIALNAYSADIDTGKVRYAVSAWIGGYAGQEDNAIVTVSFYGATNAPLGVVKLGPVNATQRGGTTGLLQRAKSGSIARGVRKAVARIVITRLQGTYNDGAVDNIELVLAKKP
jgi:hypothetical protein